MTEEHHISWIVIAQGNKTQRVALEKTGAPTAMFCVGEGSVTMYEYCNLHGLWTADSDHDFKETVCSAEFPEGCIIQ